ncbi:hypothetical protein ACIRF8_35070 [Streptomyces sp. NPDC102406]|uniref:hypothetical protein n=1 Tax=Streptomyces sp. NPDC102406 TaxID=3366171 RepID=UPI0037F8A311
MRTRISLAGVGLATAAVLGAFAAPSVAAVTEPPPAPTTGQTSEITDLVCPTVQGLLHIIQAIPLVGNAALPQDALGLCKGDDRPDAVNPQNGKLADPLDAATGTDVGGV